MDIAKKSRTELKAYFVKNAIPTESNFADLIDAMLNQKEDGLAKTAGNPLSIEATGDASSLRKAINFFESFADANPAWSISLNPRIQPNDATSSNPGFSISDPAGANRLFIDRSSKNVGIGTVDPKGALDVQADPRTGTHAANRLLYVTGNSQEADGIEFRHSNGSQGIGFGYNTIYATGSNANQDLKLAARGTGSVTVLGTLTPSAGSTSASGIMFSENPGGGAGDAAWIRYYPRTGEACTLELGVSNDGDDHIALMPTGNVGIGTNEPTHKLHIKTGAAVGLFESTDTQAFLRFSTNEGLGNRVEICNRPGGRLALWVAGGGDVFNIYRPGNIGVGNPNFVPQRNLHVEGNEIHSGGAGAGFSFANRDANGPFIDQLGKRWVWYSVGNVARLWSAGDKFWIDVAGNVHATGLITGAAGKLGYVMDQFVNSVDDTLEEGDVVVVGSNQASLYYGTNDGIPIPEVDLTDRAFDTRVCGIVCRVHGTVEPSDTAKSGKESRALSPEQLESVDRTKVEAGQVGYMVTLGAFAHCKVDADIAPVEVGDLLASSPTKGHAQKVTNPSKAMGAVIGKALGSLKSGKGKIPVLVTLH